MFSRTCVVCSSMVVPTRLPWASVASVPATKIKSPARKQSVRAPRTDKVLCVDQFFRHVKPPDISLKTVFVLMPLLQRI